MNHVKKGFYLIIYFWMLINLGWGLAIGSDNPIIIPLENLIPWIISVCMVTLIYYLATYPQELRILLLPLIGLWFIHCLYAIVFHYHPYDTLIKGVGLLTSLSCYLHPYYKKKNSLD